MARSGVDNRGRPWTAGTAFGCTLAAHRLNPVDHPSTTWGGTPPQTPPRFAALRGFFQNFPKQPNSPPAFGLRASLAFSP